MCQKVLVVPVEGGSANDYDYAYQDPINNLDDDGRFTCKWCKRMWRGTKRFFRKYGGAVSTGLGVAAILAVGLTPAGWVAGLAAASLAVGQASILASRGSFLGKLGASGANLLAAGLPFLRLARLGGLGGKAALSGLNASLQTTGYLFQRDMPE